MSSQSLWDSRVGWSGVVGYRGGVGRFAVCGSGDAVAGRVVATADRPSVAILFRSAMSFGGSFEHHLAGPHVYSSACKDSRV